jgi:hypothetical protein
MEMSFIIGMMIVLINMLTLLQFITAYFLKKNPRIIILYKKRRKNIDYRKVFKYSFIFSGIMLFSSIYHGTFIWYYIFLPISIVVFLLVHAVYHLSLENNGSEYKDITEDQIKAHEREETIDKVLK